MSISSLRLNLIHFCQILIFLVKWQTAEFKKLPVIAFKFNFKENGRPDHAKKKLNNISDHKLYFHRTFQISTNPPSKRKKIIKKRSSTNAEQDNVF